MLLYGVRWLKERPSTAAFQNTGSFRSARRDIPEPRHHSVRPLWTVPSPNRAADPVAHDGRAAPARRVPSGAALRGDGVALDPFFDTLVELPPGDITEHARQAFKAWGRMPRMQAQQKRTRGGSEEWKRAEAAQQKALEEKNKAK